MSGRHGVERRGERFFVLSREKVSFINKNVCVTRHGHSQFETDLRTNWFVSKKKIFSKWTFFPAHEPVRDQSKVSLSPELDGLVTGIQKPERGSSDTTRYPASPSEPTCSVTAAHIPGTCASTPLILPSRFSSGEAGHIALEGQSGPRPLDGLSA